MKPQPITCNSRYSIAVDGVLRVDGVPLRCSHGDVWLTLDHMATEHGRRVRPQRKPKAWAKPRSSRRNPRRFHSRIEPARA
jgi:hypothetical protein